MGAKGEAMMTKRDTEHEYTKCPDCKKIRRPIHWCNPK